MRHVDKNKKFGRKTGPRKAFLKSLSRNLIIRGGIRTTEARAKAIRPLVEKMLTKAKRGSLADRRLLIAELGDVRVAGKLIKTAEAYKERTGGYLRIVKMGPRKGDAAQMAIIEFV
ncbi:MAG: 50S ribosomal protein L17 [Patescibacteria group bacterium]